MPKATNLASPYRPMHPLTGGLIGKSTRISVGIASVTDFGQSLRVNSAIRHEDCVEFDVSSAFFWLPKPLFSRSRPTARFRPNSTSFAIFPAPM